MVDGRAAATLNRNVAGDLRRCVAIDPAPH
jgi:hypothetical protein